jgi:hypothetical protein
MWRPLYDPMHVLEALAVYWFSVLVFCELLSSYLKANVFRIPDAGH